MLDAPRMIFDSTLQARGALSRPGTPATVNAVADAGLNGFDPNRVGIVFGSAIGGLIGIVDQADTLRDRGPDRISPYFIPSVLVDSASGQLAISLGIRGPLDDRSDATGLYRPQHVSWRSRICDQPVGSPPFKRTHGGDARAN